MTTIPAPLCEHAPPATRVRGTRAVGETCGSFWDLDSLNASVVYDASYPEARGHFDPRVGALKARTLRRWLDAARIDLRGKRVCDVGFGGGSCLALVASEAKRAIGIEANTSAIE